MLILVAIDAKQVMVLGGIQFQFGELSGMTARTEPRRDKTVVSNLQRLVRLMTPLTVLVHHFWNMWIMTFHALQKRSMLPVAFLTVQQRMAARIVLKLPTLMGMTGSTCLVNTPSIRKIDIQRMMCRMTAQAVFNGKMTIVCRFMTHGTLWNGLRAARRMFKMAIQTTNCRFVLFTAAFNFPDFADVTFTTILGNQIKQYAICPPRRHTGSNKRQRNSSQPYEKQKLVHLFTSRWLAIPADRVHRDLPLIASLRLP
jgi:hypothetical protein